MAQSSRVIDWREFNEGISDKDATGLRETNKIWWDSLGLQQHSASRPQRLGEGSRHKNSVRDSCSCGRVLSCRSCGPVRRNRDTTKKQHGRKGDGSEHSNSALLSWSISSQCLPLAEPNWNWEGQEPECLCAAVRKSQPPRAQSRGQGVESESEGAKRKSSIAS